MPSSRRRLVVAVAIGAVLATVSVATVLAVAGGDREPQLDGEFRLDEPGIYAEPITTIDVGGNPLPFISLPDADGSLIPLASYVGTPLVVNVWYSSCPGCAQELQAFGEVSAELAGQVEFLGIDPVDDPTTMTEFAAARGVEYDLLRDPEQRFVAALGLTGFPTTLFVDAEGQIVAQRGLLDDDELRAAIGESF